MENEKPEIHAHGHVECKDCVTQIDEIERLSFGWQQARNEASRLRAVNAELVKTLEYISSLCPPYSSGHLPGDKARAALEKARS